MKEHNRGGIAHDAHLGGAILGFALTAVLHPEYVGYNLRVFGIVLITSIALLIYLWLSPLFLPTSAFSGGLPWGKREKRTAVPSHKGESLQLQIVPGTTSNTYTLKAEGSGATPVILGNPAWVALRIGNDMGAGATTLSN